MRNVFLQTKKAAYLEKLLLKRVKIGLNEFTNGLRSLPGDLADDAVRSGENSVLIVNCDREEMLDQELRQTVFLEVLTILLDG